MRDRYRAAWAWQSRAVAARHVQVHLRNWHTAALPPILEPLIMLLAFGLGLGSQMAGIAWNGQDLPYLTYLAPGILAYTAFMTAFFQSLFGAYIRMHYQRLWEGQLITQVRLVHVIWGELYWAMLLAVCYAAVVVGVLLIFAWIGWLHCQWALLPLLIPGLATTAIAFAALGLWFTSIVPTIDHMNLPFFIVILPIGFTSSTFFPLPEGIFLLDVWRTINPLHHLAEGARSLLIDGRISPHLWQGPIISLIILITLIPLITRRLQKRVLGESSGGCTTHDKTSA